MTPTIEVPFPEQLLGSRAVIQGASGAGKTYAIRRILETTHGRMQHFVLDVEDELFTLRQCFDYVLIGGADADAPIAEDTAGELARTLLELGVSAILQLNDLGLAGQRRVVARFLTSLMRAPRALWHPVLVTLDESHRYCPQSIVVESSGPIINLATSGRKRGFGALFATQRLSQLSKDVLGQCPNRIMGRVDQSLDRRVAADTLGFSPSSPEARRLMKLTHEFWVVGPAFAPEPCLIRFSPAITTHLVAGHDRVPVPPAPEKVRAMLGRLAQIAEKGATEPQDPTMAATSQAAETRGYQRGFKEGEAAGRAGAHDFYKTEIARITDALMHLQHLKVPKDDMSHETTSHETQKSLSRASEPQNAAKMAGKGASTSSGHLQRAGAMQLLTTAVAHWPVHFTWGQLATLNGRKARGGHFNTSKKFLVTHGLVTERDGKVDPAAAAFEKIGMPRKDTPATRNAMLAMWVSALPSPAKDMLQVIASHGRKDPIAIHDLAARLRLAPRGGHWNTGISMLRSNDLIVSTPQGFALGQSLSGESEL